MKTIDNKKNTRKLSGWSLISFLAPLILCSILIHMAIMNRTNVEVIKLDHMILEKTLRINESISKQLYRIQTFSVIALQGNGEPDNFDRLAFSLMEDDPAIISVFLAPEGIANTVYPQNESEIFKIGRAHV